MRFEPPKYMASVARDEFLRAQKNLEIQGLLDDMDLSLLTDYANTFEEVQELTIEHRGRGQEYTNDSPANGEVITGLYALLSRRREEMRKLRADLGFTVRQRNGRSKWNSGTNKKISKDDI